jgi:DNA-directed RNA polymerase subunit M/transcription elongation factor TFIIS
MLVRGSAAAKAGDVDEARGYLEWMLSIPATSEQKADAHFWLSEIAVEIAERRDHLESALAYNGAHHRARKALSILDGKLPEDQIIDPDSYSQPVPDDPQAVDAERFVCPNCGGRMMYSADGERLVCEYCESHKDGQPGGELRENDFVVGISTAAGQNKALATLSFECKACGAVYLLPPETLSLSCPHCDSAYAITKSETRELIPPEGIVPFKFDAAEAVKLARTWVRKTYSPKKTPHFSRFRGIYLPAWTFDVAGYVGWRGRIAEEDTVMNVSGKEIISYDDVFVPASKTRPPFFDQLLAQFSAGDVVSYQADYTASWLAETYTIAMSDAAIEARSRAFKEAKQTLARKEELRRIANLRFTSDEIMMASFKLVLVPVWLGHFTLEGETRDVTVSGHTSTVFGPKPPGTLEKLANWLLGD